MKKYIIIMLAIGLVASFILGVYLHKINRIEEEIAFETEYRRLETSNIINKTENILKETSNIEVKTSPNTKIIEKIYYNDCGHLKQEIKQIDEDLINKNQSEFQIEYIGWEIQKFTAAEVVVYKEIYDFCNEHFILKEAEGEIVVFALDKNNNEREAIKETGIETKYLPETDVENLEKGIKVYSITELNQLLEDFE